MDDEDIENAKDASNSMPEKKAKKKADHEEKKKTLKSHPTRTWRHQRKNTQIDTKQPTRHTGVGADITMKD